MTVLQKTAMTMIAALAALPLAADTLVLRSGETIEGTLLGADGGKVRFMTENDVVRIYPSDEVENIRFGEAEPVKEAEPEDAPEGVVPSGSHIIVRMIDSIDTDIHNPGETFRASVSEDVVVDQETLIEKGSDATVKIVTVEESGELRGREQVSLILESVTVNGATYETSSKFTEIAGDPKGKESAKVIGISTAIGAVIGAITEGGAGAAIGAATGAGAGTAIQVLRGDKLEIPSESRLQFTLAKPLEVS